MSYTVVSAKIDPQIKKEAMATADALGMPLSVVIKAFLKQFIRTKTITFSIRDEIPNEHLKSVLKQADKNIKQGKHSPVFQTGEETVAWLEKHGI